MEDKVNFAEPLCIKAEQLGRTSFKLAKLQLIDKSAEMGAAFMVSALLVGFIILFVFSSTIALALYMGELLGKNYFGFLVVAGIGLLVTAVLLLLRTPMRQSFTNTIIMKLLNEQQWPK